MGSSGNSLCSHTQLATILAIDVSKMTCVYTNLGYDTIPFNVSLAFNVSLTQTIRRHNPLECTQDLSTRDLGLQRNVMGQSTERSPLVSMLFRTFLNPLKSLMNILVVP